MKKVLLSFLLLISLILNYQIIFALDNLGYEDKTVEEQKEVLENLLIRRANLWNQMFNSKVDKNVLIDELDEIVSEPLLTYDKQVFTDLYKNNTNMDIINDLEITKIRNLNMNESNSEFDATIKWEMENLQEKYQEILEYHFYLIFEDNKWKIKDYKVN